MSLIECKGLWGEAHIMYGDPPLHSVENGVYIPHSDDGPWGLFDESRKIVIEGLDLRGATRTPNQKYLDWPKIDNLREDPTDATYLYCGWLNPHYGHFLINSLPRFWPFFAQTPNAKLLLASPLSGYPNFIKEIMLRLGIEASSVMSFDKPTIVKKVLVPTPSILEQHWIYTIYRDLCKKLA